mmetsp:Transcript_3947/g.12570  ORF Transcript_3947/g.12570 Transcript_3947/m.12570 type:complete len:100 (-) Transcript_3947:82-381(-)
MKRGLQWVADMLIVCEKGTFFEKDASHVANGQVPQDNTLLGRRDIVILFDYYFILYLQGMLCVSSSSCMRWRIKHLKVQRFPKHRTFECIAPHVLITIK